MASILIAFGTRPEAIKLAPVVEALRRLPQSPEVLVCSTGQHADLIAPMLKLFDLKADFDLNVMRVDQSPSEVSARVLEEMDHLFGRLRVDWLVVQGDTTTVLACALAGYYRRIPVAHVEAGLRTGRLYEPFPEEGNRRLVDAISALRFAPTEVSRRNLLREGCDPATILVTGNTVVDALQRFKPLVAADAPGSDSESTRMILLTAHRRESFGAPLDRICTAVEEVACRYGESVKIVYPVHPNPNVRGVVARRLGHLPNVELTEPVDYLALLRLLARCHFVLTDSGGLQEEAPSFGKPVLVLREVTERPEGVEAGGARLVGTDVDRIVEEASRLLDDPKAYRSMSGGPNPYGDGRAGQRIAAALLM